MTSSEQQRTDLLDRLADHILAHGLAAASLRPLAKAAGTSDRMLLYYFRDKSELIAAVLAHVAARMTGLLVARTSSTPRPLAQLREDLIPVLFADDLWPYMRLWLEIAALSAREDPLYRSIGERIGRGFLAWGEAQLDSPTPEARAADAARLLTLTEGLLVLKSIGLEDVGRKAV